MHTLVNATVDAVLRYDLRIIASNAELVTPHTEMLEPEIHVAITRIRQNPLLSRLSGGEAVPLRNTEQLTSAREFQYYPADDPDWQDLHHPVSRTAYIINHELSDLLEALEMISAVMMKRSPWLSSAQKSRVHPGAPVDHTWSKSLDSEYPYEEYPSRRADDAVS